MIDEDNAEIVANAPQQVCGFVKDVNNANRKKDLSQLILRNGQYQNKTARCNVCKDKQEKRSGAHATGKPSYGNSIKHPTIFERSHTRARSTFLQAHGECDNGKELDMDTLGHKHKEKASLPKNILHSLQETVWTGKAA